MHHEQLPEIYALAVQHQQAAQALEGALMRGAAHSPAAAAAVRIYITDFARAAQVAAPGATVHHTVNICLVAFERRLGRTVRMCPRARRQQMRWLLEDWSQQAAFAAAYTAQAAQLFAQDLQNAL